MAHYIFNVVAPAAAQAAEMLRAKTWGVAPEEPHRDALAPGDLALIYLAAPERTFIARAELATAVRGRNVLLAEVEEWDPPVPMSTVLSRVDRSAGARADFEVGVVQITADEYATALAVAAER